MPDFQFAKLDKPAAPKNAPFEKEFHSGARRAQGHDLAFLCSPSGVRKINGSIGLFPRFEGRNDAMAAHKPKGRKWSADVTKTSDALDLEANIFKSDDPVKIAQSLEKSAELSHRRKTTPYRSAMSMLTFYINRAGKNLSSQRKRKLEAAKSELRRVFGRKEK